MESPPFALNSEPPHEIEQLCDRVMARFHSLGFLKALQSPNGSIAKSPNSHMIPRHFYIAVSVLTLAVLGMTLYAWHMRGRAATTSAAGIDSRPVGPPVAGPNERVTLFVAYDDTGVLHPQGAQIPLPSVRQERAEELLRALLSLYLDKSSPHPLPPGSDIRSVYLVDPGLAVIDINAAFADGHRSGVLTEELTVTSLIQTLSVNIPGILRVKILVGGKERETLAGHADLSAFFDVAAVSQLSSQLQAVQ